MRASDLKYELRVFNKDNVCILYRLLNEDNLLSFINVELTDLDFLKGETRIVISLYGEGINKAWKHYIWEFTH